MPDRGPLFPLVCAFVAAICFVSPLAAQSSEEVARRALENPDDRAAIAAYLAQLPQLNGRYIVDGDQRMSAFEVRLWLKARKAAQEADHDTSTPELIVDAGGVWPPGQRRLIYAIDRSSFTPSEYRLVRHTLSRAAREWVAACQPCDLQILHASAYDTQPDEAPVTFVVRKTPIEAVVALAFFPGDDPSERVLHVTPRFFSTSLGFDQIGVMRHEVGHILGYRHEHVRSRNAVCMVFYAEEGGWRTIEGFEAHDPQSAMSYACGSEGSTTFELTAIDRAAHRKMYGNDISTGLTTQATAARPASQTNMAAALEPNTSPRPEPAQAAKEASPGPAIVIEFVGPSMTEDLFTFLNDLRAKGGAHALPARALKVQSGDFACKLYREAYGLNGCPEAAATALARSFNENGTRLTIGGRFELPDVEVETFRYQADVHRTPYGYIAGLVAYAENDTILNEMQVSKDGSRSLVTLRGRRIVLDASEPERANLIFDTFEAGDYQHASIAVEREFVPKSKFSFPVAAIDELMTTCRVERMSMNLDGAYWTMLGDPKDWPACAQSCTGPECPQVVLPDAIAHPQHDLDSVLTFLDNAGNEISYQEALARYDACESYSVAATDPESGTCQIRQFNPMCDHTTSMASIISSKANQLGFVGLSPNAPINVYDWEHASSGDLAALITKRSESAYQLLNGPQIFVFASKFPYAKSELPVSGDPITRQNDPRGHYAWSYPRGSPQQFQLRNPTSRDAQAPNRQVASSPILWITAAGQGKDSDEPWPLSIRAPVAPMNLGDQENVVVVTACETCKWPDITIKPQANYGASDDSSPHSGRAVTIAAPGDGYTNHVDASTFTSVHGGTSQATAFVGGVTTAMLRCSPEAYVGEANLVRVNRVKRRMMLTSTPRLIPDPGIQVPGVINPAALLKNPEQAWVVRAGQRGEGYQELAAPQMCPNARVFFFRFDEASGTRSNFSVSLANTRRILKVPANLKGNPFDGDRWFVFTVDPDPNSDEPAGWQVNVIGPVLIEDDVASRPLFHTANGPVTLSEIEEIILPITRLPRLKEGADQCNL